jgi:demethoxyubiquinone hydroxylase (CLK1/Coq7/Cat5 family)
MWDQEKKHLVVMNKMQVQHHVRPTILWEVAQVAGYGLGFVTALMGKEAAMACTEAVETVIGEHYQEYAYFSRTLVVHGPDHSSTANLKPLRTFPITRVCLC